MNLFAISDLHLSFNSEKPMDIFGKKWINHFNTIMENWLKLISDNDVVLICGDTSWAMNMKEVISDLNWIDNLPGKKIIIRGNHDFWWSSISKLNSIYENIKFIQNNYIPFKNYAICGSRGFNIDILDSQDKESHLKILEREKIRMNLSLSSAKKDGYEKIIYMSHYPPFSINNSSLNKNIFMDVLNEYDVEIVVYGHIHSNFEKFYDREINYTKYYLTSCDYLNFIPLRIL
ncbi:metallophosphoesterase [Candidatus Arthromitus sp. SFB-rat-Yit]|uniref:metallophosphoesterase n=1 Tax=Candidatus Arthromitus sp. SFB-rat-Yit TaxID=1041504 RepID=UPI0002DFEEFB|nr:metallophosphoesterase [Candidatus Arthromitus sp. SFB-rat-Yit]